MWDTGGPLVQAAAGQTSTSMTVGTFGAIVGGAFDAKVDVTSTALQNGQYFAQVIVQVKAFGNVTAQRQATVWVNLNNVIIVGSATAAPTLTSSRNNCQGAGCTDALGNPVTAGTPIQINGGLTELFTINMALTCTPIVGGAPFPCSGSADLNFQDAFNTNTTPNSQSNVATGTPVLVQVAAASDPSGFLSAGPASGYLVGVSGVQHVVKRGEATTAPDAVGAQVQFLFNVGDLDLNVLSGLGANYCVGVPKDSPVPPQITAEWRPLGNFNASAVNWEIQDSNHVLAGGSPVSFSSVGGLADCSNGTTCTALPTFTLVNTAPQDGVLQYFVAATITNGTSNSTKYFPFYVDVSLTQNYCGAVSSARGGGVKLKGSWSRSAAGFGGPVTMLARPASKAASTAGVPDVRVSASDISFTPSIPKAGDTVQVRFRLRNEGDGNATALPIALQVNGVTVASDTFDVPAGRSVLGGLQWTAPAVGRAAPEGTVRRPRVSKAIAADLREPDDVPVRPLTVRTAAIVVDPQHTQTQKSTLEKSAPLAHFGLRSTPITGEGGAAAGGQRLLIELGEGACIGLRGNTGNIAPCAGTADVELTAEDLSKTLLMLNTMSGVADMGAAFEQTSARKGSMRSSAQMAALAGHTYAVQLADGSSALLHFESVRNPRELDAKARATFRRNAAARVLKKLGEDSGPQDIGDLTGVGSTPTVFITITVQAP